MKTDLTNFLHDKKNQQRLFIAAVTLLLLFGLIIRVKALRDFRSLWGDEACLAINVINRDFAGLARPLDYYQAAPLLYLWTVKAVSLGLGEGEEALRLTSWLCGLAILPFSFLLARRLFSRWAALLLLFLVVISSSLIRYAIELKQYSSDALISIILLMLGINFLRGRQRWRDALILGLAGSILVWASHPAIFTLASIGITWLLARLQSKHPLSWGKMAATGFLWLGSFACSYLFMLRGTSQSAYLQSFWAFGYPSLPVSWENINWYLQIPLQLFDVTAPGAYLGAAGLFVVIGLLIWLRSKDPEAWLFVLPFSLTLLAAALHAYPFGQRLILFLVPSGLILAVKGIEGLAGSLTRNRVLFAMTAIALIAINPFAQAVDPSQRVIKLEELSPLVKTIRTHWQPQDTIYVYYGGTCSFRYYARRYQLPTEWYVIGNLDEARSNSERNTYLQSQYQVYGGRSRVWVVFTHIWDDDYRASLDILNRMGTVLFHYSKPGSELFLYDFSGTSQ